MHNMTIEMFKRGLFVSLQQTELQEKQLLHGLARLVGGVLDLAGSARSALACSILGTLRSAADLLTSGRGRVLHRRGGTGKSVLGALRDVACGLADLILGAASSVSDVLARLSCRSSGLVLGFGHVRFNAIVGIHTCSASWREGSIMRV